MVVKKILIWTAFTSCADHYLHQHSRLLDIPHPFLVVHAFHEYLSWRTRHTSTTSPSSLSARHGVPRRTSSSSLPAKSMIYPEILWHPCRKNNSVLHIGQAPVPIITRSISYKSLLVSYLSTISDETVQAETLVQIDNSPQFINARDAFNGVNGNGRSNSELLSINTERKNDEQQQPQHDEIALVDVPTPTANGGYSHTFSSRAKISAANKGKVPWNKGQSRSEEVKARISEGVLRRNRERFLAQLAMDGITEEQYNEQKKAERRRKDAERRARRTPNGGYIPSEETKQKISDVLKERYASGGMKKRAPRDPSTIRRGFTHSEETKAKIRESLKRKWAEDTEYRDLMTNKTVASGNVGSSVRKRIAETLKKRWEDPDFRTKMMTSFANRKADSTRSKQQSHRQRISDAMKQKWMDEEYRKRATEGMAKVRGSTTNNTTVNTVMPIQPKIARDHRSIDTSKADDRDGFVKPLEPLAPIAKPPPVIIDHPLPPIKGDAVEKRTKPTTKKGGYTKRKGKTSIDNKSVGSSRIEAVTQIVTTTSSAEKLSPRMDLETEQLKQRVEELDHEQHSDGCISRMREERRDLYDLLYGDEDEDEDEYRRYHHQSIKMGKGGSRAMSKSGSKLFSSGMIASVTSNTVAALFADDDDLDDFDPYGLHDTSPSL